MTTERRPRSTRDRPAKPPLSVEAVVDAGLRILERHGIEAVTMRRVATELDTGPASLYVYVRGRDELCRAMLDRVVALVPLPPADPARWRAQLHDLLGGLLRALEAHPGIARFALASAPTGEHALLLSESLLTLLHAAGVEGRTAAWACVALLTIVTATAIETATYAEREGANTEAELLPEIRGMLGGLPPERFPHVTALADELTSGDAAARFAFAVDSFVDGLLAPARGAATAT